MDLFVLSLSAWTTNTPSRYNALMHIQRITSIDCKTRGCYSFFFRKLLNSIETRTRSTSRVCLCGFWRSCTVNAVIHTKHSGNTPLRKFIVRRTMTPSNLVIKTAKLKCLPLLLNSLLKDSSQRLRCWLLTFTSMVMSGPKPVRSFVKFSVRHFVEISKQRKTCFLCHICKKLFNTWTLARKSFSIEQLHN